MMLKLLAVEASGMDVGSSTSAIYSLFVPLPVPAPSADGSVVVSAFGSLGAAQAPSQAHRGNGHGADGRRPSTGSF